MVKDNNNNKESLSKIKKSIDNMSKDLQNDMIDLSSGGAILIKQTLKTLTKFTKTLQRSVTQQLQNGIDDIDDAVGGLGRGLSSIAQKILNNNKKNITTLNKIFIQKNKNLFKNLNKDYLLDETHGKNLLDGSENRTPLSINQNQLQAIKLRTQLNKLYHNSQLSFQQIKNLYDEIGQIDKLSNNQLLNRKDTIQQYLKLNKQTVEQKKLQSRLIYQQKRLQQSLKDIRSQYNLSNMNKKNIQQMMKTIQQTKTLGYWVQNLDKKASQYLLSVKDNAVEYLSITRGFKQQLGYIGESFSMLQGQFTEMTPSLIDYGVSIQDAGKTVSVLNAQFGDLSLVTGDYIKKAGAMSTVYGMSVQESSKLLITMGKITGKSIQASQGMFRYVDSIARANNLSATQMFQDIAQNSQYATKWQKQGAMNIADAVAQAKKLGLALSTVATISQNILDFQGNIQSQLQMNLITGKQISYNRVRQLAIMGDHAQMLKQVSKIVQTIDPSNIFEWNALSQTTGMSVDQLSRMRFQIETMKQLGTTTADVKKALEKGMTAEQILKTQNFKDASMKYNIAMQYFKFSVMMFAKDVLPPITKAMQIFANLMKQDFVQGVIKFGLGVAIFVKSAKLLYTGYTAIKALMALKTGASVAGGAMSPLTSLGTSLSGFFNSLKTINWGSIGKFVAISGGLALSITALGYAFGTFSDVSWESIGKGGSVLLGFCITAGVIGKFASSIYKGASALGVLGLALLVNAGALWVFSKALIPFSQGITTLSKIGAVGLLGTMMSLSIGLSALGGSLGLFGISTILAIPSMITTTLLLSKLGVVLSQLNQSSKNNSITQITKQIKTLSNQQNIKPIKIITQQLNKMAIVLQNIKKYSNISINANSNIKNNSQSTENKKTQTTNNNNGNVQKLLTQLISTIKQTNKKQIVLNIDGKKLSSVLANVNVG